MIFDRTGSQLSFVSENFSPHFLSVMYYIFSHVVSRWMHVLQKVTFYCEISCDSNSINNETIIKGYTEGYKPRKNYTISDYSSVGRRTVAGKLLTYKNEDKQYKNKKKQ